MSIPTKLCRGCDYTLNPRLHPTGLCFRCDARAAGEPARCVHEGCDTILARDNRSEFCGAHGVAEGRDLGDLLELLAKV
jgi:hypothetical protein